MAENNRFGAEYWAERKKKRGRPKALTPKKLWELACDYFAWVDDTPFQKEDFIKGGDRAGEIVHLKTIRPYTWAGLENWIAENDGTLCCLDHYRCNLNGSYADFVDIIAWISKVMFEQKFSGAAVGAFNASIIARDLQLAEVTKTEMKAEVSGEIDYSKLSDSALEEITKQLADRRNEDRRE